MEKIEKIKIIKNIVHEHKCGCMCMECSFAIFGKYGKVECKLGTYFEERIKNATKLYNTKKKIDLWKNK